MVREDGPGSGVDGPADDDGALVPVVPLLDDDGSVVGSVTGPDVAPDGVSVTCVVPASVDTTGLLARGPGSLLQAARVPVRVAVTSSRVATVRPVR